MHQNICSFLCKFEYLTIALEELSKNSETVDVLCLSEHFVQDDHERNIILKNYDLASAFTRSGKRGGTCILIRKGHSFKELMEYKKMSVKQMFECCAVELIPYNIIVVCVYRPPSSKNVSCFLEKIEELLEKTSSLNGKKTIICGDFNIDLLKEHRLRNVFTDLVCSYNFRLEINEITRPKSKSCLDNIMHNSRGCKSKVLHLGLSDHSAQLLKYPVKKIYNLSHWFVKKRDYSKENMLKYKDCLQSLSFIDVYQSTDVNESYNLFSEIINLFYELCFPYKLIKMSSKCRPYWITQGIKKSSKTKRSLYLNLKTKHDKINYKIYTSLLRKIIDKSQQLQNNKYICEAENSTKATWNVINTYKYRQPKENITQLNHKNEVITDPNDIANIFNKNFIDLVDVYNNKTNNHNYNKRKQHKNYQIQSNIHSIFLNPVTPQDITKIIKNLKNKNSVGHDEICTKVIKFCNEELSNPLSHIINLSISKGIFPDKLKITVVKPLFKKGNKFDCENYRPIALVSVIAKIFEGYIYRGLINFFEKFKVLRDEQYGFRKDRSTDLTIYHLMRNISECLNESIPVTALFMDMTKAFDFVCHEKLLEKLYSYGVRGPTYDLIVSYLTNRLQYTEIAYINKRKKLVHTKSNTEIVKYGVPQGSILGPLLFLIYINDLPLCVNHEMYLFADDSTVVIKGNNIKTYEQSINEALENIVNWMQLNNLVINLNKTKCMQFYLSQKRNQNITIKYDNHIIEEVDEIRFLGVVLDSHANWKPHTNHLSNKISKFTFPLKKIAKTVSQKAALTAYHGFVASNLRYGIIHWGNAANINLLPVFRAQKKCIRAMFGVNQRVSCRPLFTKLRLLSLPSIYILQVCLFVKSNGHYFKFRVTRYHRKTRNKIDILPHQSSHTSFFSKSFFTIAPKIYNHLPDTLKELSFNNFKRTLFGILVEKCYYSLDEYFGDKIST